MTLAPPKPERKGHPFLTYDMIWQIPAALQATLDTMEDVLGDLASRVAESDAVYFTGCGTALHAAMLGEHFFRLGGTPPWSRVLPAFELSNYGLPTTRSTSLVAVSHSGVTKATLDALRWAKGRGAYRVGVCHFSDRPMGELVDRLLLAGNNPDRSRCHTKCYVAGALAVARLGMEVAELGRGNSSADLSEIEQALHELPRTTSTVLRSTERLCEEIADMYLSTRRHYVVGGGPNFPTSIEMALKLKETSFVSAESLEMEEMHHGPWVSLDGETLLTVIAPHGASHSRSEDLVRAANLVGCPVLALVDENDEVISSLADHVIELPPVHEVVSPFVHIVPLYLIAYRLSVGRGVNPDELRYLEAPYWEARQVVFPPGTH